MSTQCEQTVRQLTHAPHLLGPNESIAGPSEVPATPSLLVGSFDAPLGLPSSFQDNMVNECYLTSSERGGEAKRHIDDDESSCRQSCDVSSPSDGYSYLNYRPYQPLDPSESNRFVRPRSTVFESPDQRMLTGNTGLSSLAGDSVVWYFPSTIESSFSHNEPSFSDSEPWLSRSEPSSFVPESSFAIAGTLRSVPYYDDLEVNSNRGRWRAIHEGVDRGYKVSPLYAPLMEILNSFLKACVAARSNKLIPPSVLVRVSRLAKKVLSLTGDCDVRSLVNSILDELGQLQPTSDMSATDLKPLTAILEDGPKGSERITCMSCFTVYCRTRDFARHFLAEHLRLVLFECLQCSKSFSRADVAKKHHGRCHAMTKSTEMLDPKGQISTALPDFCVETDPAANQIVKPEYDEAALARNEYVPPLWSRRGYEGPHRLYLE